MSESISCNHCGRYYGHRPACPSIIYDSGAASKLRALEERKIQMSKEKTREIKGWVPSDSRLETHGETYFTQKMNPVDIKHFQEATLLIKEPEKTMKISESDIDRVALIMNDKGSWAWSDFKNELFGSEA